MHGIKWVPPYHIQLIHNADLFLQYASSCCQRPRLASYQLPPMRSSSMTWSHYPDPRTYSPSTAILPWYRSAKSRCSLPTTSSSRRTARTSLYSLSLNPTWLTTQSNSPSSLSASLHPRRSRYSTKRTTGNMHLLHVTQWSSTASGETRARWVFAMTICGTLSKPLGGGRRRYGLFAVPALIVSGTFLLLFMILCLWAMTPFILLWTASITHIYQLVSNSLLHRISSHNQLLIA